MTSKELELRPTAANGSTVVIATFNCTQSRARTKENVSRLCRQQTLLPLSDPYAREYTRGKSLYFSAGITSPNMALSAT